MLLVASILAACSDDRASDTTPKQEPPIIDPVGPGLQPPPPNGGKTGSGTTPTVFAIRHFYLGDTDRDGEEYAEAWSDYGFNLDNLFSRKGGSNHCRLYPNTPSSHSVDGRDGIDNNFGRNIVSFLKTVIGLPTESQNAAVESGRSTLLLSLDNLDDTKNQLNISGSVYSSADLGAAPAFDGTDRWPIRASSVDATTGLAKVRFSDSYVSKGVWVGRPEGAVELVLMLKELRVPVPVNDVVISMRISGTGSAATASDGVLAGSVPAALLASTLTEAAGRLTEGKYCPGSPNLRGIEDVTNQSADLVHGLENGDPSVSCDTISLGIAFDATAAQLGDPVKVAPQPDPCAK